MDALGLDFQTLIEKTIAHTGTCIGNGSVKKEDAVASLRIILNDLRRSGAPPQVLETLKDYLRALTSQPEHSRGLI